MTFTFFNRKDKKQQIKYFKRRKKKNSNALMEHSKL